MKKEDFWKPGQYPTTPASHLPQPSDDIRWQQLMEYYKRIEQDRVRERTRRIVK